MTAETSVHLRLDSVSLFEALKAEVGEWSLGEHEFDAVSDEVRVSYDSDGAGRVAIVIGFELDADAMRRVLRQTTPAG